MMINIVKETIAVKTDLMSKEFSTTSLRIDSSSSFNSSCKQKLNNLLKTLRIMIFFQTEHIPLTIRVQGGYNGKLWTEYISVDLWFKRKARCHQINGKKRGSLT